jgi:hypothetical protein
MQGWKILDGVAILHETLNKSRRSFIPLLFVGVLNLLHAMVNKLFWSGVLMGSYHGKQKNSYA